MTTPRTAAARGPRAGPGGGGRPGRRAAVLTLFFAMGAELFLVPPMLGQIGAEYGVGSATGGWVVSAYVLAYAVCTPLCGAVGDRFPRRSVTAAGGIVYALGALGCALAPGFAVLLGAHALTGVGGAVVAPAVWAYLAETASPDARGRAVAAGAAAYNGGQIVGVPLGAVVAAAAGWRWAFAAVATVAGCCALAARITVRGPASVGPSSTSRQLRASFRLWRDARFRATVVATTLSQAARLGAYTYLAALYAPRFGLGLVALGIIGGIAGLGSFLGSLLAGPLTDRWRARHRSPAGLCAGWGLLLAVALVGALTAHSLVVGVAALVCWFLAGGACYSTGQAILAVAVPERRAAAVSWNNAAMNAGVAVGSVALGALAPDSWWFWAAAAALALAGSLVSELARRGDRRGDRPDGPDDRG